MSPSANGPGWRLQEALDGSACFALVTDQCSEVRLKAGECAHGIGCLRSYVSKTFFIRMIWGLLPSEPTEIVLEPGITWQMLCRSIFNELKLEQLF